MHLEIDMATVFNPGKKKGMYSRAEVCEINRKHKK